MVGSSNVVRSLVSLLWAASPVISGALPVHWAGFERQETGWPTSIDDSVFNSSWPSFGEKSQRWNAYMAPSFNQVFLPETEQVLSEGLRYMTSNNISFLAKSGGHGYSIELAAAQNVVMINMEKFNYSRVNADGTATIGSGATFLDLIRPLAAAGRQVTTGSCPCVGATGAMLGGGVGRLQGLHGLTSDNVRKVRMALWNGTVIEASEKVNKDLFWAVRGAGQNFGVVIETTFQTYPAVNGGMHYEANLAFSVDKVKKIIDDMNALVPLPAPLSLILVGSVDPSTLETIVALNLVYAGPREEGRKYTRRFQNYSLSVEENMYSWDELPIKGAGGITLIKCAKGQNHVMYGLGTKRLDAPSFVRLWSEFGDFIKANPAANSSTFLVETFAQQGIKKLPDDYSAFPHRDGVEHLVEFEIAFDDTSVSKAADAFAKRWRDHFAQPKVSGYKETHIYQNYAHGDEPLSQLYGREKWRQQRLTAVKNKFDPRGVFSSYHPIPQSLDAWR
ncbi:uncharacterized protein PODANS_5_11050 [Podospora anserina S mat+]|uniref:Oxidoreductase n=1 Tax=Podospora anserina (strain S / ATCC MYA-4624 / DSM 980 / FGSC 10383) TaxID=515849 RepID=B2APS3_PODAN|nr:uncharacterized protein PODANS_5_11050 [Podospora anserina S mat+]CAP65902.1 unnamed protein product [Podospora anserina S mat+]CDP30235.1 Putative oxidoreductase [Podospora anserina S mat+]